MGDKHQKYTAVLTASSLTDDKTLIEEMKTTQYSVQAFDSSGDAITISGGSSVVTLNFRPVGNPSGNGRTAATVNVNSPTAATIENEFFESVDISLNSFPAGAEEVHVTIFQSIY